MLGRCFSGPLIRRRSIATGTRKTSNAARCASCAQAASIIEEADVHEDSPGGVD